MKEINDIQSIWNHQKNDDVKPTSDEIIGIANAKIKKVKNQHYFTIIILSATVLVLIYYFIFINNAAISDKILGLKMMIIVLIARVLLEVLSIKKFKSIQSTTSLTHFSDNLLSFYKFRKTVHFILTPIIYLTYCIGFTLLLPLFKINLSTGFYMYIVVSGVGFLIFFSFILFKSIKQDLANLTYLRNQ